MENQGIIIHVFLSACFNVFMGRYNLTKTEAPFQTSQDYEKMVGCMWPLPDLLPFCSLEEVGQVGVDPINVVDLNKAAMLCPIITQSFHFSPQGRKCARASDPRQLLRPVEEDARALSQPAHHTKGTAGASLLPPGEPEAAPWCTFGLPVKNPSAATPVNPGRLTPTDPGAQQRGTDIHSEQVGSLSGDHIQFYCLSIKITTLFD